MTDISVTRVPTFNLNDGLTDISVADYANLLENRR
ncbi:MAG: hypothetical protein ACI9G6_002574, partial [Limisphaerales bacterium]